MVFDEGGEGRRVYSGAGGSVYMFTLALCKVMGEVAVLKILVVRTVVVQI